MSLFWIKVRERMKGEPVMGEGAIREKLEEKMLQLEGENLCSGEEEIEKIVQELKKEEEVYLQFPVHIYIDMDKTKIIVESFGSSKKTKEILLQSCELKKM